MSTHLNLDAVLRAHDAKKPSWSNYDFDMPSLAVIVQGEISTIGVVLYTVGGHLRMEMVEGGSYDVEDLGLEPPEPGIWVWEGKGHRNPGSYEHPDEGDMEMLGDFRKPTSEEWASIMRTECPWDDAKWKRPLSEETSDVDD